VAHCRRQHDGRRPCHWQLPGLRNAGVRHDGVVSGEKAAVRSKPKTPSRVPYFLRRVHDVHRHQLPLLWRIAQFLWGISLRTNNLFSSLHHVARSLQAQKVQPLVVNQLDLHYHWSAAAGVVTDRRAPADHFVSQDIQILPVNMISWGRMHGKLQNTRTLFFHSLSKITKYSQATSSAMVSNQNLIQRMMNLVSGSFR